MVKKKADSAKIVSFVPKLIIAVVLSLIIFVLIVFKLKLNDHEYDIVCRSNLTRNVYYGIYYKKNLEIWKIVEDVNMDDLIVERNRLFCKKKSN
ncbi:MAG: hypothetical protein DRP78_01375 [Candidatus Omnitrophota bacterium]|nr:MAG: hypothetical protein DRP78_01375 [Candidatus Omnitrophota bacterium]